MYESWLWHVLHVFSSVEVFAVVLTQVRMNHEPTQVGTRVEETQVHTFVADTQSSRVWTESRVRILAHLKRGFCSEMVCPDRSESARYR